MCFSGIPKLIQNLAARRVQSAKNRLRQSGLVLLNTTHFVAVDFWQLSIPPSGQILNYFGYIFLDASSSFQLA